ncbi:MAG: hypothetical protein SVR94_17630 [Pseudomonadota bacterium]|nr:hypothetical protein [Pseudomonadota bacterium]
MPNIPELTAFRKNPPKVCFAQGRLFFTIHYKVKDNAFKRAAETWQKEVKLEEHFIPGHDVFIAKEVKNEAEFKAAWAEMAQTAQRKKLTVWAGNLLTHAWKDEESGDRGLEFRPVPEKEDGALRQAEIAVLEKLPWNNDYGYLILSGCNTGMIGQRGWTPAQAFAQRQQIITVGQKGFAYFSEKWEIYDRISDKDQKIYLWAYERSENLSWWAALRLRIRATVYQPPRASKCGSILKGKTR